ncbi:hypothetical protein AMTR_s00001p00150600 [Amborella trichopoda]|uniref:Uncharacterized protein n=1 Tax=Amborella trichopoda TaxID=13333 RepID=W1NLA9_AMBTC|nr:hypothetical protein AMTR_s00001p00150600 [Amborella trichopoda]
MRIQEPRVKRRDKSQRGKAVEKEPSNMHDDFFLRLEYADAIISTIAIGERIQKRRVKRHEENLRTKSNLQVCKRHF